MTWPERAERLWLVMTVAMLWVLSGGGEADAQITPSALPTWSAPRWLSCFVVGLNRILGSVCSGQSIPVGPFFPETWPKAPDPC